jgi:integrase
MRSGEVLTMRTCDLDTSGAVWEYIPGRHKTEHHGKHRRIFMGPRAQEILRPWLRPDPAEYLFQPREAELERQAARARNRKTSVTPSQRVRTRKARPKRMPGDRYNPRVYARAVAKACERAGCPHWHPHQLRHSAATQIRREFGLDVARIVLGHSSPLVTEIYAEVDRDKALRVMEQIG